ATWRLAQRETPTLEACLCVTRKGRENRNTHTHTHTHVQPTECTLHNSNVIVSLAPLITATAVVDELVDTKLPSNDTYSAMAFRVPTTRSRYENVRTADETAAVEAATDRVPSTPVP